MVVSRPRLFAGAALVVVATLATVAVLVVTGVIWPGRLFAVGQHVRGVDVSSYQGEIDWPVLADQGIDFAWIKATEGSSSVDPRFAANWAGATATGLLVGAYHFLSFDSPGETQAANVIATVPRDGTLPIAVDVEFYADHFDSPPPREQVEAILTPLLDKLAAHYGTPPVLYATAEVYDRYLAGAYPDHPIWIRSVWGPPSLPDGRAWTIWQYSPRDRLAGYQGEEYFIDMNASALSREELAMLAQPR